MSAEIFLPAGYDWDFFFRETDFSKSGSEQQKKNLTRVERLIYEAFSRCKNLNFGYELFGKPCDGFIDGYGLDVHSNERICIVYGSARGRRSAIAIFPDNDIGAAARYFVSLVSDGKVKINWSLYLDMLS
ncbi:MAG: hypothetical protein K2X81_14035 [Candidatus Obscuribacterales bacterium]|nr:hypothetical protein [Candidatus Obscuribacterales bacterium]